MVGLANEIREHQCSVAEYCFVHKNSCVGTPSLYRLLKKSRQKSPGGAKMVGLANKIREHQRSVAKYYFVHNNSCVGTPSLYCGLKKLAPKIPCAG